MITNRSFSHFLNLVFVVKHRGCHFEQGVSHCYNFRYSECVCSRTVVINLLVLLKGIVGAIGQESGALERIRTPDP